MPNNLTNDEQDELFELYIMLKEDNVPKTHIVKRCLELLCKSICGDVNDDYSYYKDNFMEIREIIVNSFKDRFPESYRISIEEYNIFYKEIVIPLFDNKFKEDYGLEYEILYNALDLQNLLITNFFNPDDYSMELEDSYDWSKSQNKPRKMTSWCFVEYICNINPVEKFLFERFRAELKMKQ